MQPSIFFWTGGDQPVAFMPRHGNVFSDFEDYCTYHRETTSPDDFFRQHGRNRIERFDATMSCPANSRQTNAYERNRRLGMLTGRHPSLVSIAPGPSSAAGGDYISIRRSFPDVSALCAAGFNQMPPGPKNHPHYVLFWS
jgi:hypothetical protein